MTQTAFSLHETMPVVHFTLTAPRGNQNILSTEDKTSEAISGE
jgi:hypothetical protein